MAMVMLVNGIMTAITLDRWYGRPAGNAIEHYVDQRHDNDYLADRFQTMDLDPNRAGRRWQRGPTPMTGGVEGEP